MKKILSIILTFIMCMTTLLGCSHTDNETSSTDQHKSFTLKVAMECAYSPYNWTQETPMINGKNVAEPIYGTDYYAYGYDIMVARKICDYYGWNLEIHKVEWSNIILGLQSNEYDVIIGGMKKTEERDQTVDFTEPYYYSSNCVVVPSDSPYLEAKTLADLKGISSTTQMNTALVPCLEEIPDVQEKPFYSSVSECIMAVTNGTVDSCVLSIINAKIAEKTNDIKIITFEEGKGFSQNTDVCMAVNEGNTDLQNKLNEALVALDWNKEKMNEYMDTALDCAPCE